ncbi:MAG: type IV pilin protein [bacterium]
MKKNILKVSGHTLLEILVVLAIISILVFASIPLFSSYSEQAKIDELKAVMLKVAASQERCFSAKGEYGASAYHLQNFDFPNVPNDKMALATGIIIKGGVGMTYWVNGKYDIGKEHKVCFIYHGSTMGTGEDSNFSEIKPGDPIPYSGVSCD